MEKSAAERNQEMGRTRISQGHVKSMWDQLLEKKVQTYINIEVAKVARQFHLSANAHEDLRGEMLLGLVMRVNRDFDEMKSNLYSFVQMVLPSMLANWKKAEYRRHETYKALTGSLREAAKESEDMSFFGDVFEIVARRDDIRNVHRVLGLLSPESRRVVELYMETFSLSETARRLKQDTKKFFYVTWPHVKEEFVSLWEKDTEK